MSDSERAHEVINDYLRSAAEAWAEGRMEQAHESARTAWSVARAAFGPEAFRGPNPHEADR